MEPLTSIEKDKFIKHFGVDVNSISQEEFQKKLKELRARYHPDVFEKYQDDIVRSMAEEQFKEIELLAKKFNDQYLDASVGQETISRFEKNALFGADDISIDIVTREKDLKYRLFGRQYRWLQRGDSYKIRGTEASIIIDADHSNRSIGYNETIKMYLTFSEKDAIEDIVKWLFDQIQGYASGVIISGKSVTVDYTEMLLALQKKTFLRLK